MRGKGADVVFKLYHTFLPCTAFTGDLSKCGENPKCIQHGLWPDERPKNPCEKNSRLVAAQGVHMSHFLWKKCSTREHKNNCFSHNRGPFVLPQTTNFLWKTTVELFCTKNPPFSGRKPIKLPHFLNTQNAVFCGKFGPRRSCLSRLVNVSYV